VERAGEAAGRDDFEIIVVEMVQRHHRIHERPGPGWPSHANRCQAHAGPFQMLLNCEMPSDDAHTETVYVKRPVPCTGMKPDYVLIQEGLNDLRKLRNFMGVDIGERTSGSGSRTMRRVMASSWGRHQRSWKSNVTTTTEGTESDSPHWSGSSHHAGIRFQKSRVLWGGPAAVHGALFCASTEG